MYFKVAKRIDVKSPHHEKKICNSVWWWMPHIKVVKPKAIPLRKVSGMAE